MEVVDPVRALFDKTKRHDDEIHALKSRVFDIEMRTVVLGDVIRAMQEGAPAVVLGAFRPPCVCGNENFEKIDPDTFQCTRCKAQYYDR